MRNEDIYFEITGIRGSSLCKNLLKLMKVCNTMTAATGIIRKSNRNLLSENVGPISITSNWAKSLLYRMNIVKRRGSSAAKITASNYEKLKEQFLLDIMAVIEMEEIPPFSCFNWDQTAISIVPGSTWTLEIKGAKREMVGTSDKR